MTGRKFYTDQEHKRGAGFSYIRAHISKVKCNLCGSHDKLHYHHVIPLQWGGEPADITNVLVLCKECHTKIHERLSDLLINLLAGQMKDISNKCRKIVDEFPFGTG